MRIYFMLLALAGLAAAPGNSAGATSPVAVRAFSPSLLRAMTTPIGSVSATGRLRNDNKILIPVSLGRTNVGNVHVTVREGANVRIATNSLERSASQTNLALERNKISYVSYGGRAVEKLTTNKVYFAGTAILPISATQVLSAKLFMRLAQNAMRWHPTANAYTNELIVGIEADAPEIASRLPSQTVLLTDADVDLEATRVVVERPGTSGSRSVGISLASFQSIGAVTAVSDFGEARIAFPVEPLGAKKMITLILPMPFLFAAIAGGAIGGLLRASQRKFKRWLWQISEGILVALVIVTALSAGLQFGQFSSGMVAKAVGVFAVAAIAGFVGAALLEKLAKQFTSAEKDS